MVDILITVVCLIAIALLWVMLYDSNRFVIKNIKISDERIKKPFRAVFVCDLHCKQYGRNNEKLLSAIYGQEPDMILVGGDILNANPGKSMEPAVSFIRELAGKYPLYYSNGNHEYRLKLYPETYGDMADRYEKALREIGITPMVNEKTVLEDLGITITGTEIDKYYYLRFKRYSMDPSYLTEIIGDPDKTNYQILLAHHPDYFPAYAAWGADLVLSGHAHGGIAKIPIWKKGVISPALQFFPKYDSGEFEEGKSKMILSAGLGAHTIPLRLFNPAELWVIEFEGDKREEK